MSSIPTQPTVPATLTERLIAELTAEADATRRTIARLPEDRLDWRPHPRSMALGELALHLAQLPYGIASMVDELTVDVPEVPRPQPASRQKVLDALDAGVAFAAERLTSWGDAGLDAIWTMQLGGVPLFSVTRYEAIRTILMNQTCHHRGQLTVYLRLLDVPVPSIYGPSADENPFAAPSQQG